MGGTTTTGLESGGERWRGKRIEGERERKRGGREKAWEKERGW